MQITKKRVLYMASGILLFTDAFTALGWGTAKGSVDGNLDNSQQSLAKAQVNWNDISSYCNEIQSWDTSKIANEAKITDIKLCKNTYRNLINAEEDLPIKQKEHKEFYNSTDKKYKAAIITLGIFSLGFLLEGSGSLVSKTSGGTYKLTKKGVKEVFNQLSIIKGNLSQSSIGTQVFADVEIGGRSNVELLSTVSTRTNFPSKPASTYSPI